VKEVSFVSDVLHVEEALSVELTESLTVALRVSVEDGDGVME